MKVFICEDIDILNNEYSEFFERNTIIVNDGKILQQKCVFDGREGEEFLAILDEVTEDIDIEIYLPESPSSHMQVDVYAVS